MDGLVWAFGSMLIVILIFYFLPLGLTKKGKIILVLTSFILALGGMAATASFSFLLAVLLLVVLIVFVTYLMDQRLGKWLYSETIKEQGNEDFFLNTELETAASLEKLHQQKNESTLEPLTLLKEKTIGSEAKQESEADIPLFEAEEEDISFLLNRSISLEKETSEIAKEKKQDESDYLSEIEELLKDNFDYQSNSAVNNQSFADDHEIPVISFDDKPLKKNDSPRSAKKIEDFDEIPVLPFHEKEGVQE